MSTFIYLFFLIFDFSIYLCHIYFIRPNSSFRNVFWLVIIIFARDIIITKGMPIKYVMAAPYSHWLNYITHYIWITNRCIQATYSIRSLLKTLVWRIPGWFFHSSSCSVLCMEALSDNGFSFMQTRLTVILLGSLFGSRFNYQW